MERPAFERDPYLTELDTVVVDAGVDGDRHWAVTADTLFYPEGGGQPADRGFMDGVEVVGVVRGDDGIRHHLTGPLQPGPVRQSLDWSRRFDHMQQHTAQHLLTATALAEFGWPTTAFHLGTVLSDIELDVARLEAADLRRLEDRVNERIRDARQVSVRYAERHELEELGVRSRLLPDGFEGTLRLVEIAGVDLNTCGGTHVRSTAEIGILALVGAEPMRGGSRLFFVAGDRARRRLAAHENRNLELRSLLDSADDDLPVVVALRLEREKALARESRRLLEELAAVTAESLVARGEPVVTGRWEARDMTFLQAVGKALLAAKPEQVALLSSGPPEQGQFLIVADQGSGLDLAITGPRVAEIVAGRGGGRAPFWQGKATALGRLEAAAAILREAIGA